jgi:hypothetical protein
MGALLADANRRASQAEGAVDKLKREQAWLLEQKRGSDTSILHLQASGVDLSSKLHLLQKEHEKALDDLADERDRLKVCASSCSFT